MNRMNRIFHFRKGKDGKDGKDARSAQRPKLERCTEMPSIRNLGGFGMASPEPRSSTLVSSQETLACNGSVGQPAINLDS